MDWISYAMMVVVVSIVLLALGFGVYYKRIYTFFLRQVIYVSTRLIYTVQDTGDQDYVSTWAIVVDCLKKQPNQKQLKSLDEIFDALIITLNRNLSTVGARPQPVLNKYLHEAAIRVVGVWRISVKSEIKRTDKLADAKISPKQLIDILERIQRT